MAEGVFPFSVAAQVRSIRCGEDTDRHSTPSVRGPIGSCKACAIPCPTIRRCRATLCSPLLLLPRRRWQRFWAKNVADVQVVVPPILSSGVVSRVDKLVTCEELGDIGMRGEKVTVGGSWPLETAHMCCTRASLACTDDELKGVL